MASGGEEDDGGIPLDIDNVHMLLQVEHEQIQKRTFTNWINAQLSKRCPPTHVSDLFSDLRDGSHLLDLLEVMTGQPMKRQKGRGVFQQRANIETALNFLRKKSVKLVNINIPDVIDGRPSIVLGLIWTIILHCHIEELASTLSYSSCHSSLDSLTSLDSFSGSPIPASPVPAGRTSPLHRRFRLSAKKALLMWVRDQCQRVGCSLSVKDFKKSWRSGEAFLAILCALRPQLVDLSLIRSRSNMENLEEAFHLAEKELHIPRLLEPQDVDVKDPDEKSIMTYVAQFLQYSNDMPAPDDHLQVPPSERAQEVTRWLQNTFQELQDARAAMENSSFAEKYQVFQRLSDSFTEQRKPVMTLLAAIRRCPELSQEQRALRTAWDSLDEELQRCKAELDSSLPPPLDSVVVWLQRAEAALTEQGGKEKAHAEAAKDARAQQEELKTLIKEMSHHVNTLHTYKNMDESGNVIVPLEKFDEVKRRLTDVRVMAKYQGIKLEYQESRHTVLDLLGCINAKVQTWRAPYRSQEMVAQLLQDWHETISRQGQLLILMDALQNLKTKANVYTSKAALSEDSQLITRCVKEAESEAEFIKQTVTAVRGTMERVASSWETYNSCLSSLQTWLAQETDLHDQDMSEWTSRQAKLNEAGNVLIEVTESSTSLALAEQLRRVNMQWAECMKRTKFEVPPEPRGSPVCLQALTQEASLLLRQPLEVSSVTLKANRQKLQMLSKKMTDSDLSSLSQSKDSQIPQMLVEAERACGELQRAASGLEGRLAELDHWSTEALDCYQKLKMKEERGRPALETTAKVLVSRGLELKTQVISEGQDLQDLVARVQKTSPLQHLSTSSLQDRISEVVSCCQEILETFSSTVIKSPVGKPHRTQNPLKTGSIVVARTKHVDQVGNVQMQNQDPDQDQPTIAVPQTQMLPQPLKEPVPKIYSESKPVSQPLSDSKPTCPASPDLLKHGTSSVQGDKESSSAPQTNKFKVKLRSQEIAPQSVKKPPLPPAMDRSEVHSKAQSMAKSRLLKARSHLQGRIHQAIRLFGGRDLSGSEAKRKQRALKVLQPAVLEEFLGAVEGFGVFCTEAQVQELVLLSDSVRKQWEDVRREIAAFIPVLLSHVKEGKQSFSVQSEKQTNSLHEASHTTDPDRVLQQQAVVDEAASEEEQAESLHRLCDALTPTDSSCSATETLKESDEIQEAQQRDTMLQSDDRGQQLRVNTPLRATGTLADTQRSHNLPQEQSVGVTVSAQSCGDIYSVQPQDVPAEREGYLGQSRSWASGRTLKPALRAKEQQLTARVLNVRESGQTSQAHIQAVVRGNTVETKQEPEWTVIPETCTGPLDEPGSEQEALERYRKCALVFQAKLQKNKQLLEDFIPEPVTVSNLQSYKKQLQTSKQDTDALWLDFERQRSVLIGSRDKGEAEEEWEQLTQQWTSQQMCLQSRMTSVESTADMLESADAQIELITEKLDRIIRRPVDISSSALAEPGFLSDLQDINDSLNAELKKLSDEERWGLEATFPSSLYHALQNNIHHLEQLRQRLEKVQTAARALDHFLVSVKEVNVEIPSLLAKQEENEADWERRPWQQKLQTAAEQADRTLKAAGMTLNMEGLTVKCKDVVTSFSQRAEERRNEIFLIEQEEKQEEINQIKIEEDSQEQEEEEENLSLNVTEEEAKKSRLEGNNETNAQRDKEQRTSASEKAKDGKRRRRRGKSKKEEEMKEGLVQRRAALLGALKEIQGAAEELGLKEPTLPALQQRKYALKELESQLHVHITELKNMTEASSPSGITDGGQTREVEEVLKETMKAVNERLEECNVLTELLKRFQSLRGELSGTLQRAESTISEQASYMGKDKLQRFHTKVQESKAALNGLGDRIEEVRGVCRQLHTHLRQVPQCDIIPFDGEADALMDRWLDISERTDSHLENLHLGLTLWDGVLQLGAEVENWTANKLAVFAESPSFQTDEDVTALQNEILAQEENLERFHRRAAEVQALLQSTETPLELQVVETQMRKKVAELKELASEAEDVFRQTVAAKGQISARIAESISSLQKIQDSLLALSGSDVTTVLTKLKDLLFELQAQDEQAESILDDLRVISSIASAVSLQSVSEDGIQLQEKVRNTHQLFTEVEEQTERSIQALDRLQKESQHLERWLQEVEEKAENQDDLSFLEEEKALQQRERTEELQQLVSSLHHSSLQDSALVEESFKLLQRYKKVINNLQPSSSDEQSPRPSAGDLIQPVDSPHVGNKDLQSPEKPEPAPAVRRATEEEEEEEEAGIGQDSCIDGVSDEERLRQLFLDFQQRLTSLQERFSCQSANKESSAALIPDASDLQGLLQEVTDMETDLSQIITLKDSASVRPSDEAQDSLSLQVSNLQNHKRALEDSIRESLGRFAENRNQGAQQVQVGLCEEDLDQDLHHGLVEESIAITPHSASPGETLVTHPSHPVTDWEENSASHQNNKIKNKDTLETDREDVDGFPAVDIIKSETKESVSPEINDTTELIHTTNTSLTAQKEETEPQLYDSTFNQDRELSTAASEKSEELIPVSYVASFVESTPTNLEKVSLFSPEIMSEHQTIQPETDSPVSPKKVFTIVLEMEPQDMLIHEDMSPDVPECQTSVEFPEEKSGVSSSLICPGFDEPDSKKSHSLSENLQDIKPTSASLSFQETHEVTHNQVLNSSTPCGSVAELTVAHAAGTRFQDVRAEEMTDFCEAEGQTMSSVICSAEGDVATETQTPTSDNKEQSDAASTGEGGGTESTGDQTGLEAPECRLSGMLEGHDDEERGWMAASEETQTQPQIQGSMEPERTAPGKADLPAGEATGGSPETCKHRSSMQKILSEIQGLVEKSNIINRTPHIDLSWYLKSSPGEPEIRLIRTVQKVLACRYQPAQLDVTAMAKQLQKAEGFRLCVQEQVSTLKSLSGSRTCSPHVLKNMEGQCSAALLDASATVQVKAAQLDQVKQYQRQMKIIRAFLAVVAVEKEKMSLDSLGSSSLQASKLHGLLQTMVLKKGMMEELLRISSQLSVHLSDAESSGALLAQLGDVQEEWRLLEGSIKRALQHASSSTSQSSLLVKDTKQLHAKLEALQTSDFDSSDNKSALEFVCLTTDLKLYNQLYLHLQSESDALIHFSLGQKEKAEIKRNLQEVASLLNVTKSKLDISAYGSSGRMNKQLQDLITWAKQAENHISIGRKLALFPEEARLQIAEMKKFQTDVWSRRSKMRAEVEQMKDVEKEESDQVVKTVEDLYEAIADSLDHVLDTMKKNLKEREKLLCQLASMDAWLAEMHAKRDPCVHVDNVSKADIRELEIELKSHKFTTVKIESTIKLVEEMAERCKELATGLSPGESRYLVNRLSGLWTELDGLIALEKATSWELEELIHERTSSDEELSTIQASLNQISVDLAQQKFPLTQETVSKIVTLKHMLMEHQCQAQELQHCQEAKRSALLCAIGELQDQCKALSVSAFEQEKYLHLRSQMEESRDIAEEQIQHAKDKGASLGLRFKQCQTLLVELPLVKTQCQEAADQLEAIAQELDPPELNAERQRIRQTVETLVSWEDSVTHDIKNLEAKLLLGLHFPTELPALVEFFRRTREELQGAEPVNPEEKAVDVALRRCWVIWRNMESGMRVLEGLGRKEKINLNSCKELYSLRDAAMQECHLRMESLSQARESLKDYQWASQGAIAFLHNAEATFLSAPGGFLDCTEEQKQTQQALGVLEDGFQAHICHLLELVPQQPCLSRSKTEQLHISIFSQLLVGRAILEAQAQLRLESLQSCEVRQQGHRKCHEDIRQRLSGLEAQLSECAAEQVTSYDKCVAQQKRAKLLMEDLRSLSSKIEELRAGCPMQGCGVGKGGELGALWRRWVSLRRGIGLLMAHTEQRGEEWKDITTSMEQCCSSLASLQAEVPDSSTVSFTKEEPQELLAQAEMHQAGLEQEQQALASLEHRLEHALSLSSSQDPVSPGPVGKTLVKIQENVRSLKERNLQVVAAAQAEEKERQQVQGEIEEVEQHVADILTSLDTCSNSIKKQELRKDLSSQKTKLKSIMDEVQSRYTEVPADINRKLQGVQLSLRGEEEKLMEKSIPAVRKLNSQVVELGSGLEKVRKLLEQKSPTVTEAQSLLKRMWDELDAWHSRLMILESEVQDLAEEHPYQAHLFMDQLTQPLQLYQNTAQLVEQRTAFLSKIPSCLQEFEDIVHSATCWLDEAKSWLGAPCSFTTARSLQNHSHSLQLVLDDSERIRSALQDFRPVLEEVSAVCDMKTQEEKLNQNDQQVHKMQSKILEPLEQLLQAVEAVEETETELKTMEKNVQKIRAILSSMDNSDITLTEHLQNRQVILANVQSMQRTLEEMERCKGDLQLPKGAEESLLVFSRARLLLQQLKELEQLTKQQTTQLEDKIREEDLAITKVSDAPGRSAQISLMKEVFEVSNSEEEEDEENKSCHSSSSSDTLTSSIPEDPEETFNASDVKENAETEPLTEAEEQERLTGRISPEDEMTSKAAQSDLLSLKPELNSDHSASDKIDSGFIQMDSHSVGRTLDPENVVTQSLVTAAEEEVTAEETLDQQASPEGETLSADHQTELPQSEAAVEDVRAESPDTTRTASEETNNGGADQSADLCQDENYLKVSKEQNEVSSIQSPIVKESQQPKDPSETPISLAGQEEDDTEQLSWTRLYSQISQKLTTLKKVQEDHQALSSSEDGVSHEKSPVRGMSSGSASAVLHHTRESISVLGKIVSSSENSGPGKNEELYEAARKVLLSLDAVIDLLLTPDSSGEDENHLRLIQHECVSTELSTVSDLLTKVESGSKPVFSSEEPDALLCLTSLQDGLHTVQLVLNSSKNQLVEHLRTPHPHQELPPKQIFILDELEVGESDVFPSMEDTLSVELCVLGKHLREEPGGKVRLQQASQSLLQGTTRLLELGEECITERQMNQVQNRSQLQAALCRHKKLLQILTSQLAFVQLLFQREPAALERQEDERVQLEARVKALQQQALDHQVAAQRRIQEWTQWEESCGRLGRLLDDVEAFISSEEPEGDDEELVQDRLGLCQQTLLQLDESRAALGLLLDQKKKLQTEPALAATVSHRGGALELRWQSAYRWTEQEIQRCRDIQDSQTRFHADFSTVSDWLIGANKRLKSWLNLADTSDLNTESVDSKIIQLLDFFKEVEAKSAQKASVSRDASHLLHLREADCPGLRAQLSQLDVSWSHLTSDLSKTQDVLQQCLLEAWPPLKLLCDLDDWLQKQEAELNQETEAVLKAGDAAEIREILQHYQVLKAGMVNGQLLLDFLCQSGPQLTGADVQAFSSDRTTFAENLGALRLKWLHVQRDLESQISEAEQTLQTCADRERRLQRLHGCVRRHEKDLKRWKQPTGQAVARRAQLESEAAVGRVKEAAAALQKLKVTGVGVEKGKACDVSFSRETGRVCEACEDLSQQIEALRPALQHAVEEWSRFDEDLKQMSLLTTGVRCALQQRAPVFSLRQAEVDRNLVQELEEKAGKEGETWASLDQSYQSLVRSLHPGAAQALADQMEAERKRWKDVQQQLKDELMKTAEMLSLWQQYAQLSEHSTLHLQRLKHEWEELLSSSSPLQDVQSVVHAVEKLQESAEDLQSSMGDVLSASKPVIRRLHPAAANFIQSETRLLSRDVLLLSRALSGKKKGLQEVLEQQKQFNARLEVVEEQTQNIQNKLKARLDDTDSVKQVFSELSDLFASLVDVRAMSGYLTLENMEAERLHAVCRKWAESMSHVSEMNRELQVEHQHSQSFQEKCENLTSIQKKLEEDMMSKTPQSYSSLQEMLTAYQRLEVEMNVGHQHLLTLLCQTVESTEKDAGEKRSGLIEEVMSVREKWISTMALAAQHRSTIKEQVGKWRVYRHGSKHLRKLLRDVDPLLPPAGSSLYTLHQLKSCADDYQCVEKTLDLHSTVYAQTLEAGRHLCDAMTETESQSQLQSELRAVQEAWEQTTSLLEERRGLLNTTVQKWSDCQEGITNIMSGLKEMKNSLLPHRRPQDTEEEKQIQEAELSLQRLSGGFRDLSSMKTDLSQYVAACDSALLEQQLEQLHGQWEELCTKVSLRRQEIADRLNAWTIFNDKNKEFCDWLTQMENKVCHSADLSIEEMVEKLKKDCIEEINLFSENKSHLKLLGEQLLLASDEAKQSQVHGSLQEINQRWHHLFHHIEARVKKLKETLVTMQQLDKNMSNLRSWLSRIEADLSRPITYSVCHHQEIQKRLAEQQELQRDIEQHTEGVASVLSLCDVLLRDEDAAGGTEAESDSLQETSRSLDQRWRTICALALDRRLKIEETWGLWCKFLDDYSRFEDWLKMAERTAASPNSADVLYTVAKEELKKFEGFQRQVHERLTQLELVNNQYRRLARENRTDRASQLKAMVHEGNRRWDTLHRRVASILRRLKYFTSQREDFEGTRESMLVWLTELDLQLTNVEHFSESDVHQKIQQLNSFQKEITLNTERIDGLIVFGEGLIQKSSPQDAALIEDELEELHSYCQEVFSRLVRFHQRLSQPPIIKEEPELSTSSFSLEPSLELIGRPWLGRSQGSFQVTPSHLLASPLERSGRETPVSVDSLPLEWDHTVDVGGSSSHEDEEEADDEDEEEGRTYFSALSEVELMESLEEFVEAREAQRASSLASSRSMTALESPRWRSQEDAESLSLQLDSEGHTEATPTLTSTPLKPGYLRLMSQCSGSIENIKRVSLILDEEEQPEELGLTGLTASDKQSGVIERWELLKAQSRSDLHADSQEPQQLTSDLDDITSWLEIVIPHLEHLQQSEAAASIEEMAARAKELKEMQKTFAHYKSIMLSVNLRAQEAPELQERLCGMNRDWSRACTSLQEWDSSLRRTLMRCQEFHESLHSLLLWLAHAESRRYAVNITNPDTPVRALQQHRSTLTDLQAELRCRQTQQASLQALWSQLQPEEYEAEESEEAQEKLHVTGSKLKLLLRDVEQDLGSLQQRLECEPPAEVDGQSAAADSSQALTKSKNGSSPQRARRDSSPPRSFFYRVLRAAFPLHLLLLFLLLLPCLIPLSESDPTCSTTNNFARSFYPMLRYTNGPPPT